MMRKNTPFVAIDFETANGKRSSACSVALVHFNDQGHVDRKVYTLLKPHHTVDTFNARNTEVNGITSRDVRNSPQWSDVYDGIVDFIGDDPVVAHNMAFDLSVFNKTSENYGLPSLKNELYCTLKLSKKNLPQLPDHKLPTVFKHYYPRSTFDHHHALHDAIACGDIFLSLGDDYTLTPCR